MPEGDTIARAAATLGARVGGRVVTTVRPGALARLRGRRLLAVEPVGKHLYMRFDDGIVLHTHMRMTGAWHLYAHGERWRRGAHLATAVIDFDDVTAVLFAAPVCELIGVGRVGEGLGPDILAEHFDVASVLARARASHHNTIAEVLLDQSVCAGIGNIYRCDALWRERVDPLTSPRQLDDASVVHLYRQARDLMRRAIVPDAFRARSVIHNRAGRPCPACGDTIASRSLGRPPRTLFWCPQCQAPRRAGELTPSAAPTA
jgi:endonuclease VIII